MSRSGCQSANLSQVWERPGIGVGHALDGDGVSPASGDGTDEKATGIAWGHSFGKGERRLRCFI